MAEIPRRDLLKGAAATAVGAALGQGITSQAGAASAGAAGSDGSPGPRPSVTDHLVLGDPVSERAHYLRATGPSAVQAGTVEAGQLTERYSARAVTSGGQFTVRLRLAPGQPLTLQLREVRPDDAWGAAYGFQVLLNGTLIYVRDPQTADPGGGPYSSVFIDSGDPAFTHDGQVDVTVEGTSEAAAYIGEIWAYGDLTGMVHEQGMRVPDRMVFVLGQDYRGEQYFRQRLDYVKAHIHTSPEVGAGMAVLDYYAVRTPDQLAANYQLWLRLSRDYNLPFAVESTSDWEGTPSKVPDGKGGHFGDIKYQQILWSPQDQTGSDKDVWNGQSLASLLGAAYDPHYGLSVPNVWGNTPWLTWRDPDLNAYYSQKMNESIDQLRPMIWDLQRAGEDGRILAFSTTMESTYWSEHDGEGVWDVVYTKYNDGVARRDIVGDFNPSVVAAAKADGVTLDPARLSDAAKHWLYKNQSYPQQMFADLYYYGLPRERIQADIHGLIFPADMLRHNVHSEVYSRKQGPYWSGVYPSQAQGILHRARPGSEYIELNSYSPGGFYHLQKSREFGRLANPNLENSVSFYSPDKTLLLRQTYINGSRYTSIYNWQTDTASPPADRAENWINPFIDDLHPWDVVNDGAVDGRVSGKTTVGINFTGGDLRLCDQVDVRIERTGEPAPLRLTVYDGPDKQRVVAMRYLSATEVPATGWATFRLPVIELDKGHTYYAEVEQTGGAQPAYAFPTVGGALAFRVGLDMQYERDRSLVIQWRRDASDAITHVGDQVTAQDSLAKGALAEARAALDSSRYVEAYRLAMKADSLRYPVLYQVKTTATLKPFPVMVKAGGDVDVDVTTYAPNRQLAFAVKGYTTGPVTFTVSGLNGTPTVLVDGHTAPATQSGGSTTFTVDLNDLTPHEVSITA